MGKIRKNTSKSLLFLILFCSFLVGCQKSSQEDVSCVMPLSQNVEDKQDIKNSNLEISINIDGSDSMLGYVTTPNNNYINALTLISNTFIETDKNKVEYKRIGDTKQLTRDNFRKDAASPLFYNSNGGSYEGVSSPIQSAITPPAEGKDKLTIIVTDLEGDDGGKISEELAKNYLNKDGLNKGYTVGIWGVKSQFNGKIFDPNTGKIKFSYNTEGKTVKNYRPFYVVFIGKYEQIVNYFDEIKKLDSQLEDYSKMFIFPTNNIIKESISLGTLTDIENNSKLPSSGDLVRVFALEDKNAIVTPKNGKSEPYELLEIVDTTEDKPVINYTVAFPQLAQQDKNNYSLSIDENNLKTNTKVFTFEKNKSQSESENAQNKDNETEEKDNKVENNQDSEKKNNEDKKDDSSQPKVTDNQGNNKQDKLYFQEISSNSLQQALTISNLKLDDTKQNLQFTANLNLNNLSTPRIYLFEVDLILDDIMGADWWNEWSTNSSNSSFDGAKTQNFAIFMNKLKNLSLASLKDENNNAVVGRFCYGIQKN